MIVEVVSVGSELLLGDVVNTNAAVIGRRLADEGFDSHHQVVVARVDREIANGDVRQPRAPLCPLLAAVDRQVEAPLGPDEQQGLERFYRHASQLGLAPPGVELGFEHCQPAR